MFIAHWIYRRSSFDQALDTSTTQRSFRLPHKQKQKILDKSIAVNTRRMAIANGTCVSFCNQPKVHFGLPGYAPGTIAVNVTWMKRGFNACQTHRSMYPYIFNRFPVIHP